MECGATSANYVKRVVDCLNEKFPNPHVFNACKLYYPIVYPKNCMHSVVVRWTIGPFNQVKIHVYYNNYMKLFIIILLSVIAKIPMATTQNKFANSIKKKIQT